MRGLIRDWHDLLARLRGINDTVKGWRADGVHITIWVAQHRPGMSRPRPRHQHSVLQALCWSMHGELPASDADAGERLGLDPDFIEQVRRASSVRIGQARAVMSRPDNYRFLTLLLALRPPVRVPLSLLPHPKCAEETLWLFPELVDANGRSS